MTSPITRAVFVKITEEAFTSPSTVPQTLTVSALTDPAHDIADHLSVDLHITVGVHVALNPQIRGDDGGYAAPRIRP